jgi:transcriptional regulator of acetoin/glycerol metabolism
MERAALLATAGAVTADDLCLEPPYEGSTGVVAGDAPIASSDERNELLRALDRCGWNQTAVAREFGMSRNTLAARLDLHRIVRPRRASRPRSSLSELPPVLPAPEGERSGDLP